jgi:hypothetical protein
MKRSLTQISRRHGYLRSRMPNITLVPTRTSEALLRAAERRR